MNLFTTGTLHNFETMKSSEVFLVNEMLLTHACYMLHTNNIKVHNSLTDMPFFRYYMVHVAT